MDVDDAIAFLLRSAPTVVPAAAQYGYVGAASAWLTDAAQNDDEQMVAFFDDVWDTSASSSSPAPWCSACHAGAVPPALAPWELHPPRPSPQLRVSGDHDGERVTARPQPTSAVPRKATLPPRVAQGRAGTCCQPPSCHATVPSIQPTQLWRLPALQPAQHSGAHDLSDDSMKKSREVSRAPPVAYDFDVVRRQLLSRAARKSVRVHLLDHVAPSLPPARSPREHVPPHHSNAPDAFFAKGLRGRGGVSPRWYQNLTPPAVRKPTAGVLGGGAVGGPPPACSPRVRIALAGMLYESERMGSQQI